MGSPLCSMEGYVYQSLVYVYVRICLCMFYGIVGMSYTYYMSPIRAFYWCLLLLHLIFGLRSSGPGCWPLIVSFKIYLYVYLLLENHSPISIRKFGRVKGYFNLYSQVKTITCRRGSKHVPYNTKTSLSFVICNKHMFNA